MFTYNLTCFRFFFRLELLFNLLLEYSLTNFLVFHPFLVNRLKLQLYFFHLKPSMLSTARKPRTFKRKRAWASKPYEGLCLFFWPYDNVIFIYIFERWLPILNVLRNFEQNFSKLFLHDVDQTWKWLLFLIFENFKKLQHHVFFLIFLIFFNVYLFTVWTFR